MPPTLLARATSDTSRTTMLTVLSIAIVLGVVTCASSIALFTIWLRSRSGRQQELPLHKLPTSPTCFDGQSLPSVFVHRERQSLLEGSAAPASSEVPEIRITFPDDVDKRGKSQTGDVVVIHIGDRGLPGSRPDAQPPREAVGFESLDLDRLDETSTKDTIS